MFITCSEQEIIFPTEVSTEAVTIDLTEEKIKRKFEFFQKEKLHTAIPMVYSFSECVYYSTSP